MASDSEGFREKLSKLMNLTASSEDHEALSAVRFANALIKKNGVSWIDLLQDDKPIEYRAKSQPIHPEPTRVHIVEDDDIHSIIDFIRENAWPDFDSSFIDSIEVNFEDYRKLTYKQNSALRKVYGAVKQYAERQK